MNKYEYLKLYVPETYDRPRFQDAAVQHPDQLVDMDDPAWIVELKHDGLFGIGVCVNGHMDVFSLGYGKKGEMELPKRFTGVVVGEYMYASNWAARHDQVGQFHLFDVLAVNEEDMRTKPLWWRKKLLATMFTQGTFTHPLIRQGEYWSADVRRWLWDKYVAQEDYEGLVYKRLDESYTEACWYRSKITFSLEYVVMGFVEGNGRNRGRVGSIICGVYKDGVLVPICTVGNGYSDEQRIDWWNNQTTYIGAVLTAVGYRVFAGGALRHPTFKEWREDKKAVTVTWESLVQHYPQAAQQAAQQAAPQAAQQAAPQVQP